MRGLRIELRRSAALWAGLVVLVTGAGLLLLGTSGTSRWKGNSTSALLELRLPLVYTWALVVGLAAFQGMRDGRAGVGELFASTSRPHWMRTGTLAAAVAGAVAVSTALLCAGVVAVVAIEGGFVSIGFVPLMLVTVLVLTSGALLGLALGRLLPHPLTAPVALVATFVLGSAGAQGVDIDSPSGEIYRAGLLTPSFRTPYSDLVTTSTSVDLGQLVWFAGLGLTGLVLLVARSAAGRLAALLPAGIAALVALSILPVKVTDVIVADSIGAQLVCDGPVCVSRVHADRLPQTAEAGKAALAKLAVLPGAPKEVHEDVSPTAHQTAPRRSDKIVYVDSQKSPRVLDLTTDQIRLELLAGAGVPGCSPPNSLNLREGAVRHLTAAYFNGGLAELPGSSWSWDHQQTRAELDAAWRTLSGQSPQEQLKRITQARQMLLSCADSDSVFDLLAAP
ncbi:hypothetical protein SAMN05216553_103168 [Lentzea fradiae]|uniref:ABC-type transport system involved in multi-copper enzyme maturation, permease component n=1 Tax=Lentzea fradiae TaxID=200378 RepID=A0A1G7NRA7_9PSEU|nr:hypothetical protein [Lentzea fradiae]SDF76532.1 hypothetical protein SAMN05216553_103168 [Lentzea fradiae]